MPRPATDGFLPASPNETIALGMPRLIGADPEPHARTSHEDTASDRKSEQIHDLVVARVVWKAKRGENWVCIILVVS